MSRECSSADIYNEPEVRTNGRTMRVKSAFDSNELEPDISKSVRKFEKLVQREARLVNNLDAEPYTDTGSLMSMLLNNHVRLRQLAGITYGRPQEAMRVRDIIVRVESISAEIEQLIQALIDIVDEQKSTNRIYTTHASADLRAEPTNDAHSSTPDAPLTDSTYPHQPHLN